MTDDKPTQGELFGQTAPAGRWAKYSRAKRQRWMAAGLCASCGKARDNATLACDACREKLKARVARGTLKAMGAAPPPAPKREGHDPAAARRALRAEWLARGQCTKCGRARDVEGRLACAACLAKGNASARRNAAGTAERRRRRRAGEAVDGRRPAEATADMKAYRRERRAARQAVGACTTCGGVRDTEGMVRCSACRREDRVRYEHKGQLAYRRRAGRVNAELRAKRQAWQEAGACNWCGGERDRQDRKRCKACRAKVRAINRRFYMARAAEGLCPDCGRFKTEGGYCPRCLHRRREEYRRAMLRDPAPFRVKTHNRRARLRDGGRFTPEEWAAVKRAQDYRCLACGRREPEIGLTVDHVLPVSKGGPNVVSNLAGLCEHCNKSKGAKHVDYRPGH